MRSPYSSAASRRTPRDANRPANSSFGATWIPQTPRSQYALNDVYFVDRQHGWAVGNSGVIRHTARGGGK